MNADVLGGHANMGGYIARHGSMLAIWLRCSSMRVGGRKGLSAVGAMLLAWSLLRGCSGHSIHHSSHTRMERGWDIPRRIFYVFPVTNSKQEHEV